MWQECQEAGIRILLITGDYSITAVAVAKKLSIINKDTAITGSQIENLIRSDLNLLLKEDNVFARVLPRQKLKIINALKENNQIVAMTGDGINDAPALKAAHIGIAMGQRGTDVAREAASVVLLNDDLLSIVSAIKLGRRIFTNLQKAMAYVFAIHVPIAGLSLIPLLFGWPLLFFPVISHFCNLLLILLVRLLSKQNHRSLVP